MLTRITIECNDTEDFGTLLNEFTSTLDYRFKEYDPSWKCFVTQIRNNRQLLNDPDNDPKAYTVDNRDVQTTWLRIDGTNMRLDVCPMDLLWDALQNAINNPIRVSQIMDDLAYVIDEAVNETTRDETTNEPTQEGEPE